MEVRCFLESGIKKQEKGMFEMFLWRMDDVLCHDIIYSHSLLSVVCALCAHSLQSRQSQFSLFVFFFFSRVHTKE